VRAYRICRARYARLDGEGAKLVGGRWNSAGRPMVYLAESVALAVVENLVHRSRKDFPVGYVCIEADIPDTIGIASERDLRAKLELHALSSWAIGDWWMDAGLSAVLKVPSAVVPREHLYLLNPTHPDFARIIVQPPAMFHFDPRLFG
jgi:RES domain-containing protein